MVITHIIIALVSLVSVTATWWAPTRGRLMASYVLVGLTIATGTGLVVAQRPSHLASVCLTGLVYLGVAVAGLAAARHKLADINQ